MDEAVLRFFVIKPGAVLGDPMTQEVMDRCRRDGLPVTFDQYLGHAGSAVEGPGVVEQLKRVRADGRFSGFILYETSTFLHFDAQGGCTNTWLVLETLRPLLAS